VTDLVLPPPYIFVSTGDGTGEWRRRGVASLPDISGPVTPPAPSNFNPALVFELEPLRPALKVTSRKVAPHGFVTGQLGGDVGANNNHWWDDRLPGGPIRETDNDWLVRDKPYDPWEESRPRPNAGGVSFEVLDKAWELQQVLEAGLDGLWVDWLALRENTGDNRTGQVKDYVRAAAIVDPTGYLKVAPMIDGNTSIGQVANLDTLLVKTGEIAAMPGAWKLPDGRLLMPVYMPEGSAAVNHDATAAEVVAHYTALSNRLASEQGVEAAFWWCPQRGPWYGTAAGQGYGAAVVAVPRTIGLSRWGTRDPVGTANPNSQNAGAASYCHTTFPGMLWCAPVSVGDSRPNQNKRWEQEGFGQLLASWRVAIEGGADSVQIPTLSDYPEHAHIGPSRNHGWVWLDLMAYYSAGYKLGAWPTVVRDGIYLAHRIHPSSGFTTVETGIPTQVLQPSTSAADIVDVLVFLTNTDGTEVRITSGGITTTFTPDTAHEAYGGVGVYRFTVPLRVGGPPQAEIVRGGVSIAVAASTWSVTNTPLVEDWHYRAVSSLRQKVGNPA
jgi:hypothetical protein